MLKLSVLVSTFCLVLVSGQLLQSNENHLIDNSEKNRDTRNTNAGHAALSALGNAKTKSEDSQKSDQKKLCAHRLAGGYKDDDDDVSAPYPLRRSLSLNEDSKSTAQGSNSESRHKPSQSSRGPSQSSQGSRGSSQGSRGSSQGSLGSSHSSRGPSQSSSQQRGTDLEPSQLDSRDQKQPKYLNPLSSQHSSLRPPSSLTKDEDDDSESEEYASSLSKNKGSNNRPSHYASSNANDVKKSQDRSSVANNCASKSTGKSSTSNNDQRDLESIDKWSRLVSANVDESSEELGAGSRSSESEEDSLENSSNNNRRSANFDQKAFVGLQKRNQLQPTQGAGISPLSRIGLVMRDGSRICYACSSLSDPNCFTPDRRTQVKYCRRGHNSCLTTTYSDSSSADRLVIRDCGETCDASLADAYGKREESCAICSSDLCNNDAFPNSANPCNALNITIMMFLIGFFKFAF